MLCSTRFRVTVRYTSNLLLLCHATVCLERQPSRSINIVGKDDINRHVRKSRQVERFRDIQLEPAGAAVSSHAPSVFIPQPYCQLH